jgi:hypothetical protein
VGDEERIVRVVGRRRPPPAPAVPSVEVRRAMDAVIVRGAPMPKGVFRFRSHEEANADRLRWLLEEMVARASGG